MGILIIVDGAGRVLHTHFQLPKFGLLVASSQSSAFLICCGPCCFITLLLFLPVHKYLFSLPGPDRWECSGIKDSVFTILFTGISAQPFGRTSPLKKNTPLFLPSSPILPFVQLDDLRFMWGNIQLDPFSSLIKDVSVLFLTSLTYSLGVYCVHRVAYISHCGR